MRAHAPQTRIDASHLVISTPLEADDGTELEPIEVRVSVDHADLLDPTATPGAATLVTLAALRGEDLVIDGAVDERTVEQLSKLASLMSEWWGTHAPRVEVADTFSAPTSGEGVALLFSRGVDSWSTLLDLLDLEPPDRVTHLVTVHNGPPAIFRTVEADIVATNRAVARELGLEMVVVATTARTHLDAYRRWMDTCGAVLTGCALQVGTEFGKVVLSGANPMDVRNHTGADPELITAMSTGGTEVVFGNPTRTRDERIAHLAGNPLARATLQVCWEGLREQNCGRCRKCQFTMASLALAGDPDPSYGFDHGPDPDFVRSLTLGRETNTLVSGIIAGLGPEYEDLRRAWSDAWDRTCGVEVARRWGDDDPPGLAGPGVARRVAEALRATSGQANAPAPAPLGWSGDAVALRPPFELHHQVRELAGGNGARPHAWAVIEHHLRDQKRDGLQAELAQRLIERHGSGPCYLPGILWDHLAPPVLDGHAVQRLLQTARARLWWRDDGDLEPIRVVEAIENGCLPLQVMPSGPAADLAGALPAPLAALVIAETDLEALDLSPAAVATRLGPAVDHLLNGSAEHDLLAGAYR